MGQQVRPGHAAGDWTAGGGLLHHLFAATTGFLDTGDLDHLHLRGDHIEKFADILSHHTQITTAIRAAGAGIEFTALPRRGVRDTRTAAELRNPRLIDSRFILTFIDEVIIPFGDRNQQVFQGQFQLFDLTLNLLRRFAERQFLQLCSPQT